jgi:tetratricopeptide (TPR) repeat protein
VFFRRHFQPVESTGHSLESDSRKVTFLVKKEVKQLLDAGRNYLDEGRLQEAILHYKKALDADPGCALCYFNLAYASHENGDNNSAKSYYEKAVELEPTCSLFLEHLARLNFERKEFREAIRLFQRAAMVGKLQPLGIGLWGRALFELGMYEQSLVTFENLLEAENREEIQIGAYYWLAISQIKIGRIAAARRTTEKILSFRNADHKILYDLGENFIETRCLSLAKKLFERLIIEKEELLLARLRIEDIRSLENKINDILPNLFNLEEELLLHQIHVLQEFGNDRVSKALLSFATMDSAPVRESVIHYQTTYGYNVADKLLFLLNDEFGYVREAAYDYYETLDDEKYLHHLLPGLEDPIPSIRRKTAKIIGRFGSIEYLPTLEMAMEDPRNHDCKVDIRQAISSVKQRYQKNIDALYNITIPVDLTEEGKTKRKGWKLWLFLFLQFSLLAYFLYVLLTRF